MKDIKIIKNLLSEDYVIELTRLFLPPGETKEFPWFYNPNTTDIEIQTERTNYTKSYKDSIQFTHVFWNNMDVFGQPDKEWQGNERSPYWDKVRPIFYFLNDKCGIKYKAIIRCKANLLLPVPNYTKDDYNFPHVDHGYTRNYLNVIYYLDDSDGDTFIFNECNEDRGQTVPTNLTIKQRVRPEKNSVLIFEGNQYHASSNPIKSKKRIVINITVSI